MSMIGVALGNPNMSDSDIFREVNEMIPDASIIKATKDVIKDEIIKLCPQRMKSMIYLLVKLKVISPGKDMNQIVQEFFDGLLNETPNEEVTNEANNEVANEITNEEAIDGQGVTSNAKVLLKICKVIAKLDAKIDNLTEYHKTGKWPDN
ncbi:hypothetical protein H0G86_004333 [Trichoderma simmonsii]|uniref:Uncharacterized protein n=1 Tax=Trichoderma simmonsii TaxID=1491479 RepID=A0A8G0PHU2_9HYPO|nr:hypothetical protein H0G86_004333 [Trichoderma simmonsii]